MFMALFGLLLGVMAALIGAAGNGRRVTSDVNARVTTAETIAQLLNYEIGLAGYRGTGATSVQSNVFADPTLEIGRGAGTDPDTITVRYFEDRFYDAATSIALVETTFSIGANEDGVLSLLRAEDGGAASAVVSGVASIKVALFVRRSGDVEPVGTAGIVPADLAGLSLDLLLTDGTEGRFLVNLPNAQSATFF